MGQGGSQAFAELIRIGVGQAFGGRDDDVIVETSQDLPLDTERLADLAFHFVSLNGIAARLERDAQTVVTELVRNAENSTLPQTEYFRAIEKSAVFPRVM
jgi:hypothetical protein